VLVNQAAAPFIPENAPFSPEQRAWLNGFLAGLFSTTAPAPPRTNSLEVDVLFASQSGVAERLAKKMAKRLKEEGHNAKVRSVEALTATELAQSKHAIFFASTYGEGDPPDSARAFRDQIFAEGAPRLEGLRYAIFCLGDRNYEHFCRFGVELDCRLEALGATRVEARRESDVEVDEPFTGWSSQVLARLSEPAAAKPAVDPPPAAAPTSAARKPAHTRENPFYAELVDKQVLTHASSSKQTVHVSFNLADGDMHYEPGDACGVLAQNDPALVAELLDLLPFPENDTVTVPKVGDVTAGDALRFHLQPTRLTRKIIQAFARKAECNTLGNLLRADQGEIEAYTHGRGLIDLLRAYPGVITSAAELVEVLPRLTPRLYSISSSPSAHGRELHCTVAVVRYETYDRRRGGVASTMLAERIAVGARAPIYLQPNKRFRLPADTTAPIIMIGPGTGIAPFRAFLHERRALGHKGRNWLFFGERSAKTDFLYGQELQQFVEDGHLTRLDTAFSRDQEHKVYVQDRMVEAGSELFRWIEEGASLYVCGDASRMAKDVDLALHRIVETHGQRSPEAAQEYTSSLNEHHRYHRDVY
jgi:sulfite reductase (NADPH) flavoprotein alpha-component